MPNSNPAPFFYDGAITGDVRKQLNNTFIQQLFANITPVQATNPTSATDLQTVTLPAGTLTTVGQTLELWAAGLVNLTTTTAALTLALKLGGVSIASFTTGNITVGFNSIWNVFADMTVASVSSTGAITLEVHGSLDATLASLGGSVTTFNDSNTAVSSSIGPGPLLFELV